MRYLQHCLGKIDGEKDNLVCLDVFFSFEIFPALFSHQNNVHGQLCTCLAGRVLKSLAFLVIAGVRKTLLGGLPGPTVEPLNHPLCPLSCVHHALFFFFPFSSHRHTSHYSLLECTPTAYTCTLVGLSCTKTNLHRLTRPPQEPKKRPLKSTKRPPKILTRPAQQCSDSCCTLAILSPFVSLLALNSAS